MAGIYQDAAPLRTSATLVPIAVVEPPGHARGGIVVLHEAHRLSDALLGLLRQLAGEGWLAVAPDLFHRVEGDPDQGVFGDDLFEDVDACLDWLTGRGVQPDCIGVLGFDEAGTAAFLVAATRPVAAAVSVAARGIVEPLAATAPALVKAAPRLQAPWLGLFGIDDPATPAPQVDQLAEAVAAAPVATHIVRYTGLRHRADRTDDVGPPDDELVDAQTRVFDWFDSFLR